MAAPTEKPLQTRFGFVDEDLKTPAHDALMFWIDENISEILAEIFNLTEAPKIVVKRWEFVLKDKRGIIIGSADMYVHAISAQKDLAVFIEAKPKIRALGELIRQINIYKAGSDFTQQTSQGGDLWPKWLVVSPEVQFADKLREQGILFQKSPPTQ
jgi:hypothetical protein